MPARIIDGKAIAAKLLEHCRATTLQLAERGIRPGLAVVLVGNDPASTFYVRSKEKTCKELGYYSVKQELPADTTQAQLLEVVRLLNADPAIHGILVQSPPPPQIDEAAVVNAILPEKDVDGFHPVNVAKLAMGLRDGFVPCTPLGCQRLLVESGVTTAGAHAVVIGRSMIVGKPMALLLMQKGEGGDATVTVVHSRSRDIAAIAKTADILIAAIGRPNFVTAEFIKPGATIIDVGINRVEDASNPKGYRIVGDVDFEAALPLAGAITPVPGGVGPMTIAMLMANTLQACQRLHPV